MSTQRYEYEFSPWPSPDVPRNTKAVFDLYRVATARVSMDFTEQQFNDFREELAKAGIELREISRKPHHAPESVM